MFAGAGGLSLGAQMAGINVALAIEKDIHAAATYAYNHPKTKLIIDDIKNINQIDISCKDSTRILFGGPPCQGFSTSNQRTRNKENPLNWLVKDFVRIVKLWLPDWVVFENVRGFVETAGGLFHDSLIISLSELGYTCSCAILCASDFGVPQIRSRFVLVASRNGIYINITKPIIEQPISVGQAISDLPSLPNGARQDYLNYDKSKKISAYAKAMRCNQKGCSGHLVTHSSLRIIERYKYIPQGGNWASIPEELMSNYSDRTRCHTGIYYRLRENEPAVTLGNYRKSMLVHPWENRGLSVREAARLQSFPDSYNFQGSIGFQQQQVGNAVPPLLAKSVFEAILKAEAIQR